MKIHRYFPKLYFLFCHWNKSFSSWQMCALALSQCFRGLPIESTDSEKIPGALCMAICKFRTLFPSYLLLSIYFKAQTIINLYFCSTWGFRAVVTAWRLPLFLLTWEDTGGNLRVEEEAVRAAEERGHWGAHGQGQTESTGREQGWNSEVSFSVCHKFKS